MFMYKSTCFLKESMFSYRKTVFAFYEKIIQLTNQAINQFLFFFIIINQLPKQLIFPPLNPFNC